MKASDHDPISSMRVQHMKLKLVQIGADVGVAKGVLARSKFTEWEDHVLDRIVYSLRSYIHGMGEEKIEIHLKYPQDWWQAVKEVSFPKWALKRWPVQYRHVDISESRYQAVCPHLNIETPKNMGDEIHLAWMKDHLPLEVNER